MRDKPDPVFGDTLFSGSRFIFWSIGPLALLVGLAFGAGLSWKFVAGGHKDHKELALGLTLALLGVSLFLVLLNGRRFWWAGRIVTAIVFAGFLWYFLDEWFGEPAPPKPDGSSRPREDLRWQSLCGFALVGLPCLWYTFVGRFGRRP